MANVRIHETSSVLRHLGLAVLAIVWSASVAGCDVDDRSEDDLRASHFELDDPEQASRPELVEAIEEIRSMGIDPDEQSVELWKAESGEIMDLSLAVHEGYEAERPPSHTTLPHARSLGVAPEDDVARAGSMACSEGDDGCVCCCYAGFGGVWGCGCEDCW